MTGPHPATAAIRVAVRHMLAECAPGDVVLVACSGGADSLALAAAVAFEAPRLQLSAGAVVVDHQLATGSARVARTVREQCLALGLDPVVVRQVSVTGFQRIRSPGSAGFACGMSLESPSAIAETAHVLIATAASPHCDCAISHPP